jgi:large subunit ribosomal protein L15
MVNVHKRKKNSRLRGARTAGWGFRQKHKGHGNKGGFGKAGTGKKGDHDKQRARESDKKEKYFGKQGATSRGTKRDKTQRINLYAIKENIFTKAGQKIDLKDHVVLATGEGFKAEITAKRASAAAIKKMEAAGGKIVVPEAKKAEAPAKEEATEESTEESEE